MPGLPAVQPYVLPGRDTIPAARVPWTVDPARAVLLVHDMQQYFVRCLPDVVREDLVRRVRLLRARADVLDVPVAYTAQPGGMTPVDRGLLADVWGPGMSATAEDRDVVPGLTPLPGDWQLTKWRYSAFVRSTLLQQMRDAGRDQLVICGVYAHVGVLMTAADAFQHDIQPFVVADAVADFSLEFHRLALDWAADRCAAVVVTDEVFA